MQWLNYHHFMYFWLVVREGGIQAASRKLRLAHPTVSVQIKQLEEQLGQPLFDRTRRKLELTEAGQLAFRYADEIFSLGREFLDALEGQPVGRPVRLVVGISDVMPKLVVRKLLDPALHLDTRVRLTCLEDHFDHLLGALATHDLDVVLADTPCPPGSGIKAFNHLLGECGVSFFAAKKLAPRIRARFPESLDGAPMLMPSGDTALGRAVVQWCESKAIRPEVVAEFNDSALMKAFGQDGVGVFPLPQITETDVKRQYGAQVVGRVEEIRARFYAISPERRLKNPAVVAVCETARDELFS
ncbi:MAG TPA: transcriptional activator NhaR [Polyangiales bacterium]|nr:transcriptional activator NhaR [Polyangiales bacterium]